MSPRSLTYSPLNPLEVHGFEEFLLALRSANREDFLRRISQAKKTYSLARTDYHKQSLRGLELRALAWGSYLDFFLARNASIRRRAVETAWSFAKESMDEFDKTGDGLEFARTYDQLGSTAGLSWDFQTNPEGRGRGLKEGADYGRKAAIALARGQDDSMLARICAKTATFIDTIGNEGADASHAEELDWEGLQFWKKAEELDKTAAVFQVCLPPGGIFRLVGEEDAHRIHNEALEAARKQGDNFAIGWILGQHAGWRFFDAIRAPNLADSVRLSEEALAISEESYEKQSIVNFVSPNCGLLWSVSPYAEHFIQLSWFQTDEAHRKQFLKKAEAETSHLLKMARLSGYRTALAYADHVTSKVYAEISESEPRRRENLVLLRKALKHRRRACRITRRIQPNDIHRNSVYLSRLGEIQASIAGLQTDRGAKIRILSAAVRDKEKSARFGIEYTNTVSRGKPHLLHRVMGVDLIVLGDLFVQLYRVDRKRETLERSIKAYTDAINFLKLMPNMRRLGEAYWKAGEVYDQLGSTAAAAEHMNEASKLYVSLAEKNVPLAGLFRDYARYLEAWVNIEHAMSSHRGRMYDESERYYQKAAELHQAAGRWGFLYRYYSGLAKRERAERLSESGHSREAASAFKEASEEFVQSKISLRNVANRLDEREEKPMVDRILHTPNQEYCDARASIEEARTAEETGEYAASVQKFHEASILLGKAANVSQSKRERDELLYISSLAKAWEQMTRSNNSDRERGLKRASSLFKRSIELAPDEASKLLASGHMHFCDGLVASDRFNQTLDPSVFEKAVTNLALASTHFANSGHGFQSVHAEASKLFLDATMEMASVAKISDPAARGLSYEKIRGLLVESATGFEKANQKTRQGQVQRLIELLDTSLGVSLKFSELAGNSPYVSPLVAFPSLERGHELPLGHSRFSTADIEAKYIPVSKNGEEYSTGLELANSGSQPIRLLKVQGMIPDNMRLIDQATSKYRVEGTVLVLEPVPMPPLTVQTLKVRLHREGDGPVIMRPKIVFLDDRGRTLERSLPGKMLTDSRILRFLAKEFLLDSRTKRLSLEHCGWRTLTTIVSSLKIPRSHVYGEPRWGHKYGRQLESLLTPGLVETRVFPGERGRGGEILKVRLAYENDIARDYVETTPTFD